MNPPDNPSTSRIRAGITIGDLNGVGAEIIIKTLMDSRILDLCTPIVFGSSKVSSYYRKGMSAGDFTFNVIKETDKAHPQKANMVNCWDEEVKIEPGLPGIVSGQYAFRALEMATQALTGNKIDVLITAPINKHTIHSDRFPFKGHTEYLANLAGSDNYLMLMVGETMKIGTVTDHIPLKEVSAALTTEKILSKLRIMNKTLLQDFGVRKAKISVLGLNPHAGDKGLIGDEEQNIIIPAIEKAKQEGILVSGPYGADGLFGSDNYRHFDGILAMYHDQGLIPFKAMSFDEGVNFTAGLPIVRTSPDHGVGYDIAGKNIASENSLRRAIYLACDIFGKRKEYKQLTANPLKHHLIEQERD